MTFLELCRQAREWSGIPGTGPTSVTGQQGELRRLCGWVSQAWLEIQNQHQDWQWMRKDCTFDTVAQQTFYGPLADVGLTDFARWRTDSFSIYLKSSGKGVEIDLTHCDYDSFKDEFLTGTRATTYGQPIAIAIAPNKSLALGSPPDNVYTVEGEYYKTPQILVADADIPDLPERFHAAIIHKALVKYGYFESASEVIQEHSMALASYMYQLEADQLPPIFLGGSLI